MGWIKFVGNSLLGVFLMFVLTIGPYNPQIQILFNGNRCGNQKCLQRLIFFIWTTALGEILTIDNLSRQKVAEEDWCCMCKRNGETTDHLLLHCPVSQELWNMVCSLFGVHWVMPHSVVELLACWSNKFNRLRSKTLWRMIPYCFMWVIWRERNTGTFNRNERSIHELTLLFFQTLFDWENAMGFFSFIPLLDMLDFCTFIVTCFFFPCCF